MPENDSHPQSREVQRRAADWTRPQTQGYRVFVRVDPINSGDNQYGGVDLCRACWGYVVGDAMLELSTLVVLRAGRVGGEKEREGR